MTHKQYVIGLFFAGVAAFGGMLALAWPLVWGIVIMAGGTLLVWLTDAICEAIRETRR